MEGTPHLGQRLVILKIGLPLGRILGQGFQYFPGLFDEDLYQFFIKLVFFHRRRRAGRRHRLQFWLWLWLCRLHLLGCLGKRFIRYRHLGFGLFRVLDRRRLLGDLLFGQVLRVIAQQAKTLLCDIQNAVTATAIVLGQAFEVVVNAGDDVSQRVQRGPVRHQRAANQLFGDIATARRYRRGCAGQRHHGQTATHAGKQGIDRGQLAVIPLIGNEGIDRFAGLFQRVTRFLHHQLMDQRDILRCSKPLHIAVGSTVLITAVNAQNALQTGFHVEHATGHIHQGCIGDRRLARRQPHDLFDLLGQHPPRLAKPQHRQRVGNALHHRQHAFQSGQVTTITAYEQVELILDLHKLFAQRQCDRLHGLTIRTDQPITGAALLFVPAALELITLLEGIQPGAAVGTLGNIKQQVAQQLTGWSALQRRRTPCHQLTQLLISLAQQLAHRRAVVDAADFQTFGNAGKNRPELGIGGIRTQRLKTHKHIAQVPAILGHILATDHIGLRHLQRLSQLAQLAHTGFITQIGDSGTARRGLCTVQRRTENRILGQQLVATGGAHVVEQWQQYHRQVTSRALHPIQVRRHLQDGLHQDFECLALAAGRAIHQRLGELFHFLGEQGCAIELDHLQRAMNLVDIGQAKAQPGRVLGIFDKGFKRLTRLIQRFGYLALDPVKRDIIMPITHIHSRRPLLSRRT